MSPTTALIPLHQRPALHAGAKFISTNPFTEEWVALERVVICERFDGNGRVLSLRGKPGEPLENTRLVGEVLWPAHEALHARLAAGATFTDDERAVYVNSAILRLYDGVDTELQGVADTGVLRPGVYALFVLEYERLLGVAGGKVGLPAAPHLFALFYQFRRAFYVIHTTILGVSLPVARLRASVWDAIFAGGLLLRYASWSFDQMERGCSLIVGPTGTGKELVARALGVSRYLPFDPQTETFAALPGEDFHLVNISALPVSLIDTLLFGHARGTFTGAIKDAEGVLARCRRNGTLFLDEIGDLEPEIQVKLLRVLQEWRYTRLGDAVEQEFWGRIVAATQPRLLRGERLRDDFYYRISESILHTPTLRARIDEAPGELRLLVRAFAEKKVGPHYAEALTEETLAFIDAELRDHPWPGNVRELRVCVGNVMSHHAYTPRSVVAAGSASQARPVPATLDELQRKHAEDAVEETGSRTAAAQLLGVNYRTLRRMLGEAPAQPGTRRPRRGASFI